MMLTIHGLPATIKYQDLKQLVKHECNIPDFILDSLVKDDQGPGKKMKIGVANDAEGSTLVRCLDGFQLEGHVLRVVPVRQAPAPSYNQQASYGGSQPHQEFRQEPQRAWYQYQGNMDYQPQQSQAKPFGNESYSESRMHHQPAPVQQNYGYQPKHTDNVVNKPQERTHVLRNIQIMDTPIQQSTSSYREPTDRPIVIAKDTFQGPGFSHGSSEVTPWAHNQSAQKPRDSFTKPVPQFDTRSTNYDSRNLAERKRGILKSSEPFPRDSGPVDKGSYKNDFSKDYRNREVSTERGKEEFRGRFDDKRETYRDTGNFANKEDGRKDFEPKYRDAFPRKEFPPSRGNFPRKEEGRKSFDPPSRGDNFPRTDFEPPPVRGEFPKKDNVGRKGDFNQGRGFGRDDDFQSDRVNIRNDLFARDHQAKDVKRDEVPRKGPFVRDEPIRRISPRRRSPAGPLRSPTRREGLRRSPRESSPRTTPPRRRSSRSRYSPSDNFADTSGSYPDSRPQSKQVRPAYDSKNPVQNQPIYSGSFRPNLNENVQYPAPGRSQPSKWQDQNTTYTKKPEEDRRDFTRPPFEKPIHRSRSPIQRERSPLRRRNSPSRSPRRSWALEKRRSPEVHDAPPPPSWPGQNNFRSKFENDDKRSFTGFRNQETTRQFDAQRREELETSDVWKTKPTRPNEEFNRRGDSGRQSDNYPRDGVRSEDRRKEEKDFFPNRSNDFRKVPDLYRKEDFRKELEPRRQDDYRKDFKPESSRQDDYHRYNQDRPNDRPGFDKKPLSPSIKQQRDKAAKKIADGICERRKVKDSRVYDELKLVLTLKMNTTFEDRDVEATDILVWFYQRYNALEQDEMFNDVVDNLHKYAKLKRPSEDLKPEVATRANLQEPPKKITKTEQPTQKEIVKAKYKMTIEVIRNRILKENNLKSTNVDFKRVVEELTMVLLQLLLKFGEKYGPSCDIMNKYTLSYTKVDEEKMLQDVFKKIRDETKATGASINVPPKYAKASTSNMNMTDVHSGEQDQLKSRWDIPAKVDLYIPSSSQQNHQELSSYYQQPMQVPTQDSLYLVQNQMPAADMPMHHMGSSNEEYLCNLYLCKDDFGVISLNDANWLKEFLVGQIFEETAAKGWAPNFTLKGLKSLYRYEVATNDGPSRDWLTNLDFSKFSNFNVLVYNKEELWYERAAVWLPGHSKSRFLEPLVKLQLQNKNLKGLNIDMWKLVKKINNAKGTRIYVDMPPASARVLEVNKMQLSYELQKVNVFLKAIAVDKDAFDLGLKETSITDKATLAAAVQNTPMPFLSDNANMVKICLKGNKHITTNQAKTIKEMLIAKIFKYHQESFAKCRTDFVKYGYCQPGYFLVEPENDESKKWLTRLVDIGKLNKHEIVVLGEEPIKYLNFWTVIPKNQANLNGAAALDSIKHCNRVVQGLHFVKWKVTAFSHMDSRKARMDLQIDLDSVETLKKLHFKLEYRSTEIKIKYDYKNLAETIRKLKSELVDSYDVANMELGDSDEEDVVLLD